MLDLARGDHIFRFLDLAGDDRHVSLGSDFDGMDYVDIVADVTMFQGQIQLNVKRTRKVQEGEYEEVKPWGLQRGIVIWGPETWVSPLPFMSWGALQKGLTLSEPPFCHLENGANDHFHPLSFRRVV